MTVVEAFISRSKVRQQRHPEPVSFQAKLQERALVRWLVGASCRDESGETFRQVTEVILKECDCLDTETPVVPKTARRRLVSVSRGPSSTDDLESVDTQTDDNSPRFLLVSALRSLLEGASIPLHDFNPRLSSLCFSLLHHVHSSGVRFQASRCLATLSRWALPSVVALFVERMQSLRRSDEYRAFSSYQRAASGLVFSLSTDELRTSTLEYLRQLMVTCVKVERGVLREQICVTLSSLFDLTLSNSGEWEGLSDVDDVQTAAFCALFRKAFIAVQKWSRKAKHAIFCTPLLVRMVALASGCVALREFGRDQRPGLIKAYIVPALSKAAQRDHGLNLAQVLLEEEDPEELTSVHREGWFADTSVLLQALFPKQAKPSNAEIEVLAACLAACAKVHLSYALNDWICAILKSVPPGSSPTYSTQQKNAALRSLRLVADKTTRGRGDHDAENVGGKCPASSNALSAFTHLLEPLVVPHFHGDSLELLRSALPCFPRVVYPANETTLRELAEHVASLTMHADRELSHLALEATLEFTLDDPRERLLPAISVVLQRFSGASAMSQHQLLRAFSAIKLLLVGHLKLLRRFAAESGSDDDDACVSSTSEIAFSPREWPRMRNQIEGAALFFLASHEPWVREEARALAKLVSTPAYRAVERMAHASQSPSSDRGTSFGYLEDTLSIAVNTSVSPDIGNEPDDSHWWAPELEAVVGHEDTLKLLSSSVRWARKLAGAHLGMLSKAGDLSSSSMVRSLTRFVCSSSRMRHEDRNVLHGTNPTNFPMSRESEELWALFGTMCAELSLWSPNRVSATVDAMRRLHPTCREAFALAIVGELDKQAAAANTMPNNARFSTEVAYAHEQRNIVKAESLANERLLRDVRWVHVIHAGLDGPLLSTGERGYSSAPAVVRQLFKRLIRTWIVAGQVPGSVPTSVASGNRHAVVPWCSLLDRYLILVIAGTVKIEDVAIGSELEPTFDPPQLRRRLFELIRSMVPATSPNTDQCVGAAGDSKVIPQKKSLLSDRFSRRMGAEARESRRLAENEGNILDLKPIILPYEVLVTLEVFVRLGPLPSKHDEDTVLEFVDRFVPLDAGVDACSDEGVRDKLITDVLYATLRMSSVSARMLDIFIERSVPPPREKGSAPACASLGRKRRSHAVHSRSSRFYFKALARWAVTTPSGDRFGGASPRSVFFAVAATRAIVGEDGSALGAVSCALNTNGEHSDVGDVVLVGCALRAVVSRSKRIAAKSTPEDLQAVCSAVSLVSSTLPRHPGALFAVCEGVLVPWLECHPAVTNFGNSGDDLLECIVSVTTTLHSPKLRAPASLEATSSRIWHKLSLACDDGGRRTLIEYLHGKHRVSLEDAHLAHLTRRFFASVVGHETTDALLAIGVLVSHLERCAPSCEVYLHLALESQDDVSASNSMALHAMLGTSVIADEISAAELSAQTLWDLTPSGTPHSSWQMPHSRTIACLAQTTLVHFADGHTAVGRRLGRALIAVVSGRSSSAHGDGDVRAELVSCLGEVDAIAQDWCDIALAFTVGSPRQDYAEISSYVCSRLLTVHDRVRPNADLSFTRLPLDPIVLLTDLLPRAAASAGKSEAGVNLEALAEALEHIVISTANDKGSGTGNILCDGTRIDAMARAAAAMMWLPNTQHSAVAIAMALANMPSVRTRVIRVMRESLHSSCVTNGEDRCVDSCCWPELLTAAPRVGVLRWLGEHVLLPNSSSYIGAIDRDTVTLLWIRALGALSGDADRGGVNIGEPVLKMQGEHTDAEMAALRELGCKVGSENTMGDCKSAEDWLPGLASVLIRACKQCDGQNIADLLISLCEAGLSWRSEERRVASIRIFDALCKASKREGVDMHASAGVVRGIVSSFVAASDARETSVAEAAMLSIATLSKASATFVADALTAITTGGTNVASANSEATDLIPLRVRVQRLEVSLGEPRATRNTSIASNRIEHGGGSCGESVRSTDQVVTEPSVHRDPPPALPPRDGAPVSVLAQATREAVQIAMDDVVHSAQNTHASTGNDSNTSEQDTLHDSTYNSSAYSDGAGEEESGGESVGKPGADEDEEPSFTFI